MANFVNPLSSVAGFRNQQLSGPLQGSGTSPAPTGGGPLRSAQEAMDAGTPDTGFGQTSKNATRQHQLYLQAIQAQRLRQQPKVSGMSGGSYGYSGGSAGNPKGLVGRYKLLSGADQALGGLNAAFQKQFGYGIKVASGGRTYAEQKRLYEGYKKGLPGYNLAARPGTSQHESGRAIDFGGALQNANSREHKWLQQNAGAYGFKWTGKNFKQFEPWHWEWWG